MRLSELRENLLIGLFIASFGYLAIALFFPYLLYDKGYIFLDYMFALAFAIFLFQILLYCLSISCINLLTESLIKKISRLNGTSMIDSEIEPLKSNYWIAKVIPCVFGVISAYKLSAEEILYCCLVIFFCMLYILYKTLGKENRVS